jgi:hypothetical protein
MNESEMEIRNTIGQLEKSLTIASRYMDEDTYSDYCDLTYGAIAKLRAAMHKVSDVQG